VIASRILSELPFWLSYAFFAVFLAMVLGWVSRPSQKMRLVSTYSIRNVRHHLIFMLNTVSDCFLVPMAHPHSGVFLISSLPRA
jgi:hypothetical protein